VDSIVSTADITGTRAVPNTNQIRFLTASGLAPVFDYLVGEWSTFTGHESVGCTVWDGKFVFARSDGSVLKESDTRWDDGGTFYKFRLKTAHLPVAQVQGFQRVRELRVLGTYHGPHRLRVGLATDYSDSDQQSATFDPETLIGGPLYGVPTPYGTGVFGGTWKPYQFGVRVTRAKSEAISVTIEDLQSSGYNEALAINGLALIVGVKPGLFRIPAERRA
jgi:hypothetical protein